MIPVFIGIVLFGILYYFLPTPFFTYVGYIGSLGGLVLGAVTIEQLMWDHGFWRRNGR